MNVIVQFPTGLHQMAMTSLLTLLKSYTKHLSLNITDFRTCEAAIPAVKAITKPVRLRASTELCVALGVKHAL